MTRLITLVLIAVTLALGTAVARAIPHHPMQALGDHGGHGNPIDDGCTHEEGGHKGMTCPMLACFASAPALLPTPDIRAFAPIHRTIQRALMSDGLHPGTFRTADPPVPRLSPA